MLSNTLLDSAKCCSFAFDSPMVLLTCNKVLGVKGTSARLLAHVKKVSQFYCLLRYSLLCKTQLCHNNFRGFHPNSAGMLLADITHATSLVFHILPQNKKNATVEISLIQLRNFRSSVQTCSRIATIKLCSSHAVIQISPS